MLKQILTSPASYALKMRVQVRFMSDVPRSHQFAGALAAFRSVQAGNPADPTEMKARHQPGALIRGTSHHELEAIAQTRRVGYDPKARVKGKEDGVCMAKHLLNNDCLPLLSTTADYDLGFHYASTSQRFTPGQGAVLHIAPGGLLLANQAKHWDLCPEIYETHDECERRKAVEGDMPVSSKTAVGCAQDATQDTEIDIMTGVKGVPGDFRPHLQSVWSVDYVQFMPEFMRTVLGDHSYIKTQPVYEQGVWKNPNFSQLTWSFDLVISGHCETKAPKRYEAMNRSAIEKRYIQTGERLITQADAFALHVAFSKMFPEITTELLGVVKSYNAVPAHTKIGSDEMVSSVLKKHESHLRSCSLFNNPTKVIEAEQESQLSREFSLSA